MFLSGCGTRAINVTACQVCFYLRVIIEGEEMKEMIIIIRLVLCIVALISFITSLIIDKITCYDTISVILHILGWACLLANWILFFIGRYT